MSLRGGDRWIPENSYNYEVNKKNKMVRICFTSFRNSYREDKMRVKLGNWLIHFAQTYNFGGKKT